MPTVRRTRDRVDVVGVEVLVVEEDLAARPGRRGSTSCIRFRVRSRVDLPQPDGPMKAVTDRGSTVIRTSSTALKSP